MGRLGRTEAILRFTQRIAAYHSLFKFKPHFLRDRVACSIQNRII